MKPPTLSESTAGARSGWWLERKVSWKRWVSLELGNWQHLDNKQEGKKVFQMGRWVENVGWSKTQGWRGSHSIGQGLAEFPLYWRSESNGKSWATGSGWRWRQRGGTWPRVVWQLWERGELARASISLQSYLSFTLHNAKIELHVTESHKAFGNSVLEFSKAWLSGYNNIMTEKHQSLLSSLSCLAASLDGIEKWNQCSIFLVSFIELNSWLIGM